MLSDQETARYFEFLQTIPPPKDRDLLSKDEDIEAAWNDGFKNGIAYEQYRRSNSLEDLL